jgi:PAS domain S-box-containing protein
MKALVQKLINSELRYRRLFEAAQDGILILDGETGMIEDVNPYLIRMLGYPREEFIKKNLWEVGAFKDIESCKDAFEALQEDEYTRYENLPLKAKDGRLVQVEFVSNVYFVDEGKVIQCNIRDISDRKLVENALQVSETKFRRLFEAAQDGILILDAGTGMIEDVNPYLIKMLGYSREELVEKKLWEVGAFKDIESSKDAFEALQEDEYIRYENLPLKTKGGRLIQVEFVSNVYLVDDEKVIQCNIRDITSHKRIVAALQANEKKYHDLVNQSSDGVFIIELSGKILTVNTAMCQELEFSEEEFLSMSIWDIIPEQYLDQYRERLTKVLEGKSLKEDAEYAVRGKDGKNHYVEVLSAPHYSGKDIIGFQGIARDITARKQAEEELTIANKELVYQNEDKEKRAVELAIANKELLFQNEEKDKRAAELVIANAHLENLTSERKRAEDALRLANERLRYFIDANIVGVLIANAAGDVLEANDYYLNLIGYTREELERGQVDWRAITPPEWLPADEQALQELRERGECKPYEKEYLRRDGTRAPVLLADAMLPGPGGQIAAFAIDITARKLVEEALRQSENTVRAWLNAIQESAFLIDREGIILAANATMARRLHRPVEELVGTCVYDFIPPQTARARRLHVAQVIESGQPVHFEDERFGRVMDNLIYPVFDQSGQVKHMAILGTDITERKQADELLRESEDKFKYMFDYSTVGKSITLPSGEMNANKALCDMFGYTQAELQNKKWQEITHPDDIELTQREIDQLLSGKRESARFNKRYIHKAGSVVWVDLSSSVRRDKDGKPLYLMTSVIDTTERKRAEDALRESERKLREAQEMAHLGFWFWDVKTGDVEWSDEVFKIFCLDPKEFTPQIDSILALSPWPEDHQRDQELINRAMETHRPGNYEQKFLRPDQSIGHYYSTFQGVYDENGDLISIVGTILDITERKQADETIRSLARFPAENPNPVLRLNRDGKLLYANEAAFAQLTDWDFQADRPAPGILQNMVGEVFETQKTKTAELPCGERVFSFSIAPAPDDEYVNLYARDMTALFLARDEIRLLNVGLEQRVTQRTAQLEAANKELEAFSYSVSHDLRAPLRGIDGWSMALLEDYSSLLDEQGKTYLNRVRFETQRMGDLIDDLLQFSRLARVEMCTERVDLGSMARRIAARLRESEPQRQVKFKIQKGLSARCDAHLMEVALTNLLNNAFKFTSKTRDARIEFGQTEIEGQCTFFVRDNGAGFDMAFSQKLFGVFQRLHNASEFPGTGVGLATVQRILHRHGGRIWAESAVNRGATFYFTLEE